MWVRRPHAHTSGIIALLTPLTRYENDVVEEDVYIRFKDDTELDKAMPKKTIAVQQASNFYDRLAQPDE
jgi:hypothetical protein